MRIFGILYWCGFKKYRIYIGLVFIRKNCLVRDKFYNWCVWGGIYIKCSCVVYFKRNLI